MRISRFFLTMNKGCEQRDSKVGKMRVRVGGGKERVHERECVEEAIRQCLRGSKQTHTPESASSRFAREAETCGHEQSESSI